MIDFLSLSDDVLSSIAKVLPLEDILSFSSCSRHLHRYLSGDHFWAEIWQREFGEVNDRHLIGSVNTADTAISWKLLCRYHCTFEKSTWSKLALGCGPAPRASLSAGAVNGKIVLFGGGGDGGRDFCDTWYLSEKDLPIPPFQKVVPRNLPGSSSQAAPSVLNVSDARPPSLCPAATHVRCGTLPWRCLPEGAKHPPARFVHAYAVVKDCLVIFGGIAITGERLNDTWVCDLSSDPPSWSQLEFGSRPCPSPRGAAALSSCGGSRAVLFGGISRDHRRMDDTWLLDLDGPHGTPSWRQLLPHAPAPSGDGGAADSGAGPSAGDVGQYAGGSCEQPPARSGHALAHLGQGRVLMFGGRDSTFHFLDDTWAIDLSRVGDEAPPGGSLDAPAGSGGARADGPASALAWCRMAAVGLNPTPRAGHSLVGVPGGRAMLFGGEEPCPQSCSHAVRSNEVWVFQGGADATPGGGHGSGVPCRSIWRKLATCQGDVPTPRAFHASVLLGGGSGMLVFGGMVSVGGTDLENIHASFTFKNDTYALVFVDTVPA